MPQERMSEKKFRQGGGAGSRSKPPQDRTLGRIAKIRQADEAPKQTHRERKAATEANKVNFALFWSCLLGLTAIIFIGFFAFKWAFTAKHSGAEKTTVQVSKTTKEPELVRPTEKELMQLMDQAMAISKLEDVPKIFHLRETPAEEILAFMQQTSSRDGIRDSKEHLGTMASDSLVAEGASVTFVKPDGKTDQRLLLFTPDAQGEWKMEFEAYARTCSPPIGEFMSQPEIKEATVRVYIAKDIYYNSVFDDDRVWACFLLSSPDFEDPFYAYSKLDSPEVAEMVRLLRGQNLNRATLLLRKVEGATNRQFELARVLTEEWVLNNP